MITLIAISIVIFTLNNTLEIVKTLKDFQRYETKKKREDELFEEFKKLFNK